MKANFTIVTRFLSLVIAAITLVGCSLFSPPTASFDNTEAADYLWSPEPGFELVPGRPVPIIIDEDYWETPGMVNPFRGRLLNATPVPIDGEVGGTVTCGRHNYQVPPGAVDGTVNFTMSLASEVAIGVDCGPSPLYFADGLPVRLTLSFEGTQYDPDYCERAGIEPLDPSELGIYYVPANNGTPVRQNLNHVLDMGSKTISVDVDHFSRYIIA